MPWRQKVHSILSDKIDRALKEKGLLILGGFRPDDGDGLPDLPGGQRPHYVLLAGNAGPEMWRHFSATGLQGENPLDDWCRTVLGAAISTFGEARALFVSDGPPYWPFQAWAVRSGQVHQSPLGILIHHRFGLWHAYRAAILLPQEAAPAATTASANPCESCHDKPCLKSCPVDAIGPAGYDVAGCVDHIGGTGGDACLKFGCAARRACPVGSEYHYAPPQAEFHMTAFTRAAGRPARD
jgi:hypothetical protein